MYPNCCMFLQVMKPVNWTNWRFDWYKSTSQRCCKDACYLDNQVLLVEFIHGWHYFWRMSSIQFSHVSCVEPIHSHSCFLVISSLSVCTIIIVVPPKHPGLRILLCSHKTDMIVWHKAQQESQHRDLKSIIYIFFNEDGMKNMIISTRALPPRLPKPL